ncbi:hypothetical protein [Nocardia seriolae]|uniref:Uncharacterized protein n=1 Tax=Nocardia seriolae TaxID=37332 RepID=A0A0B8N8N3_9NOCA|nr:hypothetical protein [Nocardia seriolae]APA99748.1 hypothetical protein NS506_05705 [Nocardia seriolae]MTJ62655.1 hypothetical protein [Nocardia seriolae]MTJ73677.1 hypothetical protein [Nocardia seriolae]MTJ89303.1 hypothetical protein [Nocardia seriolae]MTK33281.1 hypothetical protein [Nocardia seriolae]
MLSFTGRGRIAGAVSATALFAAGLLLSTDTLDQTLPGDVGFGTFGLGAWLLFAATVLALLVTVLAGFAAARAGFVAAPGAGRDRATGVDAAADAGAVAATVTDPVVAVVNPPVADRR